MKRLLSRLYRDERGFVVTAELVIVGSVLVLGLVAGTTALKDRIGGEMSQVADAFGRLDQSYAFSGAASGPCRNTAVYRGVHRHDGLHGFAPHAGCWPCAPAPRAITYGSSFTDRRRGCERLNCPGCPACSPACVLGWTCYCVPCLPTCPPDCPHHRDGKVQPIPEHEHPPVPPGKHRDDREPQAKPPVKT
ncbi:MAG: hypothetical protein KY476_06535 [Planctomycetes bacterium]|nr:hypothetical protein [Planctomycetota bacterium]